MHQTRRTRSRAGSIPVARVQNSTSQPSPFQKFIGTVLSHHPVFAFLTILRPARSQSRSLSLETPFYWYQLLSNSRLLASYCCQRTPKVSPLQLTLPTPDG